MTKTDKLKVIVEKAGGKPKMSIDGKTVLCVTTKSRYRHNSLDDLFALAKKIGVDSVSFILYDKNSFCRINGGSMSSMEMVADTPAEALLNALYSAVKEG